jgi:uncharacterized membrane protein YhfC
VRRSARGVAADEPARLEGNVLYLTYSLNALLMMAMPILLGLFVARRLRASWGLYAVGAATFVGSQVVHLPLNAGLTALFANGILPVPPEGWRLPFNAVVLGLTAGLCEESARFLVYSFWIRSARTWREAVMFGAGHGGAEALLLGALVGLTFLNMLVLQNVDPASLPVPADQRALAARQISDYWSAPWPATLLGAVERAFTLCFHVCAAVLVLRAVARRNLLWLGAAILLHTGGNASAILALVAWGPYWAEVVVGAFAGVSLVILFALKPRKEETPLAPTLAAPAPQPKPTQASPPDPEADIRRRIDETRFTS